MYLVTGASTGIGYATAYELLRRGASVALIARRVIDCSKIHAFGDRAITISADVATEEGLRSIVSVVGNAALHGVVHAAGSNIPLTPYEKLNPECLSYDMAVHVASPIAINNLFGKQLNASRIVYIDSYSANAPRIGWAGYSIVKSAAQMAAKAAAAELTQAQVIRVFPGGVRTPLVEAVLTSTLDSPTSLAFKKLAAEGAIAEPEAIGRYIANILLNADEQQLASREFWNFNDPEDQVF